MSRDEQNLLTPDHINAQIVVAEYLEFSKGTIVCALTLVNGYQVLGESRCPDPARFDRQLGRKMSYDHARSKIWAFEGYLERSKLTAEAALPARKPYTYGGASNKTG